MRHSLVLLLLCVAASRTVAHPVPAAQALVELDDGNYLLTLHADVAALVMDELPGHLGDMKAEDLRALTDEQLRDRIQEVRRRFALALVVAFDGQKSAPEKIEFPEPSEVRHNARAYNTDDATSRIRVRGRVPPQARTLTLSFTEDVGPVRLTVRRGNETLHQLRLEAGQGSGPLALVDAPAGPAEREGVSIAPVVVLLSVVVVMLGLTAALRRLRRSGR